MFQIIEEEGLDRELILPIGNAPGMIQFYSSGPNTPFSVELNGERGPVVEYHGLTEEEACNKCLELLRMEKKERENGCSFTRRV